MVPRVVTSPFNIYNKRSGLERNFLYSFYVGTHGVWGGGSFSPNTGLTILLPEVLYTLKGSHLQKLNFYQLQPLKMIRVCPRKDLTDSLLKPVQVAKLSSPSVGVSLHMVLIYKPEMQYLGFMGPTSGFVKNLGSHFISHPRLVGGLFYDFY